MSSGSACAANRVEEVHLLAAGMDRLTIHARWNLFASAFIDVASLTDHCLIYLPAIIDHQKLPLGGLVRP